MFSDFTGPLEQLWPDALPDLNCTTWFMVYGENKLP